MAIIPVPAKFSFTKVASFKLQRSSNILRSKFTGQAQVIVYPFAVWMLQATLVEYDGLDAGKIRSFLAQLDGQKNTFRLPVPGFTRPMTGYLGPVTGLSANAAARASVITVYGLITNVPILAEGDYFTINDELKICTQAANSDGTGQATINFKPPLRKALLAGAQTILFQNPTILMRAADDDVADWGISAPVRQQTKFNAVEDIAI